MTKVAQVEDRSQETRKHPSISSSSNHSRLLERQEATQRHDEGIEANAPSLRAEMECGSGMADAETEIQFEGWLRGMKGQHVGQTHRKAL